MRAALLLILLAVGCGVAAPTPAAPPASGALMDDTDVVSKWYDAATKQMMTDARAAATKRFADKDDAAATLATLTPAGLVPRPEFFGALFAQIGGDDATKRRVAAYTAGHQPEIDLANQQMLGMLQPLMDQVFANIRRQFSASAP